MVNEATESAPSQENAAAGMAGAAPHPITAAREV